MHRLLSLALLFHLIIPGRCLVKWEFIKVSMALIQQTEQLRPHVIVTRSASGPGEGCPLKCIAEMSRSMGSMATTTSGIIQSELFNRHQLDHFCEIYKQGKNCLHDCGDGDMVRAVMAAFSALDYLCIDHYTELVSYLSCFKDSESAVKQRCDPRCGGMGRLKDLQLQQQSAQLQRDLVQTTSVLGQMCLQLDCETACQAPIIQRICRNDEAGNFMRRFARGSLRPLEDMMLQMVLMMHSLKT